MGLAEDYRACRRLARRRGANFSVGLRLLPTRKRGAADAVYAFCRYADDLADEEPPGTAAGSALDRLDAWEEELDRAYSGRAKSAIGRALSDAVRRFPIPIGPFRLLIEGGRRDQGGSRVATEREFLDYCRLVAWTISDLTLPIFGFVDDRAREWGRALSTALQRTNVLRDVGEDARRGRVYLPGEALARHGVSEDDLAAGRFSEGLHALLAEGIRLAREDFARAEPLLRCVTADARICVALLGGVYRRVLERIAGFPRVALAHDRKASLTRAEKSALVARAFLYAPRGRWP
jgi:phytoene synthase